METISSIADLLAAVRVVVGEFGETWWRGQPGGEELIPCAYRKGATHKVEWLRMTRFMQKAPTRYQQVPGREEYLDWLFLMQHHRLPTRLLDWTESPLIACYFAVVEDQEEDRELDGCIWALSPIALNTNQFPDEFIGRGLIHPDKLDNFLAIAFCEEETEDRNFEKIAAILTTETNSRMIQQQSVFTFHGTKVPLDQLPKCDPFLKSFRIPSRCKESLSRDLSWLGIHESSLFPDLDHLATDICRTFGPGSKKGGHP